MNGLVPCGALRWWRTVPVAVVVALVLSNAVEMGLEGVVLALGRWRQAPIDWMGAVEIGLSLGTGAIAGGALVPPRKRWLGTTIYALATIVVEAVCFGVWYPRENIRIWAKLWSLAPGAAGATWAMYFVFAVVGIIGGWAVGGWIAARVACPHE